MSQFISLNTVIGNSKSYKVPIYQRDYSWRKNEEVEDLWNDILDIENEKMHYMGYLVLLPENKQEECYYIIDGQQRLITLSLLALAVIKLLTDWSESDIDKGLNEERIKEETRRYIGNIDTSAEKHEGYLPIIPKLRLNKNNDDYYKSYLLQLREAVVLSKQKPSIRLMQLAFNFFYDKLKEHFGAEKSGAKLTRFLEKTVGNGLVFTVIEVQSDLDAFKVFETLNARGVKLSPADLLKNYLFSQVAQSGNIQLEEAERRWMNISNVLGKKDISTFIRHYWNSRYKITREPMLFKAIKNEITGAARTFDLLNSLERQAEFYAGFDHPSNDELWNKEERTQLQVINLLEVSTCYSLMMAYLEKLDRKEFYLLVREIAVISLRYHLAQLNPNIAEIAFSETANKIYSGTLTNVKALVDSLKPIYVDDKQFEVAFASAEINTKRKKAFVKYLLVKIENQIANTDYQYESASVTIEHILPENPGGVWEKNFDADIQDYFIYRIGNYTLLNAGINNKLDNEMSFSQKLEWYRKSAYKLSSEYCEYDDFTPTVLENRQERLAKIAKGIWKSAYIHSIG
jgi:uncharacterized protein with ParB-like and HNH nuclease domain